MRNGGLGRCPLPCCKDGESGKASDEGDKSDAGEEEGGKSNECHHEGGCQESDEDWWEGKKGQRTEDKSVDAKGPWVTKLVYECEGGEGHEVRESDLHKDKLKNQREEGCI